MAEAQKEETKTDAAPAHLTVVTPPAQEPAALMREAIVWTKERIELVKTQVCPRGITDDEFAVFIEQCKRTQLDPLIKEAYCVPRNVNAGTKGSPRWITKHEFQPGADGMLARADRFPDFRGLRCAAVYSNDEIMIDEAAGEVHHRWNPIAKQRGELVGAWAMALREGRRYPVEWVLVSEYRDERNPKWNSQPQTMIVKVARAAALRRAYPNTFGGLYISDELPRSEFPQDPEEETETTEKPKTNNASPPRGTQAVREKVKEKAKGEPKTVDGTATRVEPPKDPEKKGPPVARWGDAPWRGKPLQSLDVITLRHLMKIGEEKLKGLPHPEPTWAPTVRLGLEELEREIAEKLMELEEAEKKEAMARENRDAKTGKPLTPEQEGIVDSVKRVLGEEGALAHPAASDDVPF